MVGSLKRKSMASDQQRTGLYLYIQSIYRGPGSEPASGGTCLNNCIGLDVDEFAATAVQMNKNILLKAKVGTDALTAALAVKSWGAIGTTGAASVGWNIQRQQPQLGFALAFENYGNIR